VPPTTVSLLGRPGCHLCDDALAVVTDVLSEFEGIALDERSILDDAELLERYRDEIPVVLIDGVVHTIWRVDAARFRAAVREAQS
jgi:glutaredoxin